MRLRDVLLELLFPRKCLLCQKILDRQETDLCRKCRTTAPAYAKRAGKIRFIQDVTAVWDYQGEVRHSLLRYKFYNVRSLANGYGRLLAMKISESFDGRIDMISWIPVSRRRRRKRGYDQVELIGRAVCAELACPLEATLVKHTDTKPNSALTAPEARRANVLGAYHLRTDVDIRGKRILMLDDIVTTGATASECARILLGGGAKEVYLAAVASAGKEQ